MLVSPARILVVDDKPENCTLLGRILGREGYDVHCVSDRALAVTKISELLPDLILLDITMPDLEGHEICELLQADPHTQDVPVIFVSAHRDDYDNVRAFEIGGADYITKPFESSELRARVRNQLNLRRLRLQLREQNDRLQQEITARRTAESELRRLVNLDELTQIANRRYFDACLVREWQRLQRRGESLAAIIADVDCFKAYNDYYGHLAGDRCLIEIAAALSDCIRRPADLIARYGGEEFVALLPNTDDEGAAWVAARMCEAILQLQIPHERSPVASVVTISAGASTLVPTTDRDPTVLIACADSALYRAKQAGRNCSVLE